jgi:hypothetical protein
MQDKLPISIGILGWNSINSSLPNTLFSYLRNDFFNISDDITIFFQEISEQDIKLANYFDLKYIGDKENIGIANAFKKIVDNAKYENILILEHDWYLQENFETVYKRIKSSINLLDNGYDCIKLRSMNKTGFPDFSHIRYTENPLNYYDPEIQQSYPHLLDTCHIFKDVHLHFPNEISQVFDEDCMYYTSTSRYGNYTNNPCMYKTKFYKNILETFETKFDSSEKYHGLESMLGRWWATQSFKIAHSEGLFTHFDIFKYAPYWETINHYVREKNILK